MKKDFTILCTGWAGRAYENAIQAKTPKKARKRFSRSFKSMTVLGVRDPKTGRFVA